MRERVARLAAGWRRLGYELDFGVGIAQGHATLGRIGFEGRSDYAAIGSVTNLAARLCAEAGPGQILISHRVLASTEDVVTVEPVGTLELRGFLRPARVYDVVGVSG
jgi:class 3 adenylate cyclase